MVKTTDINARVTTTFQIETTEVFRLCKYTYVQFRSALSND